MDGKGKSHSKKADLNLGVPYFRKPPRAWNSYVELPKGMSDMCGKMDYQIKAAGKWQIIKGELLNTEQNCNSEASGCVEKQ